MNLRSHNQLIEIWQKLQISCINEKKSIHLFPKGVWMDGGRLHSFYFELFMAINTTFTSSLFFLKIQLKKKKGGLKKR